MNRFFGASRWITGLLILSMPIALIYFLGSQMAYGQVQNRYEIYSAIPEYTRLDQLGSVEAGASIMLRGTLQPIDPNDSGPESNAPLLIYQERPLDGREVRFQETFPLVMPPFTLQLEDATVQAASNPDDERIISHESRRVVQGDREFTGFQAGDLVTLMGKWQPAVDPNQHPTLAAVTGVSSIGKASLLTEVGSALAQVKRARNWLGIVTLISILLLCLQLYLQRKQRLSDPDSHPSTKEEKKRNNGFQMEQGATVAGD